MTSPKVKRVTRRPHTVSSWRLLLRALSYHRGQTIAVFLVTALITGGAVFAPWYARMVDDTAVPAAVSTADAEMYDVSVGDLVPEVNSAYNAVDLRVTGIYDVADTSEPYWFDVLPTERSG